ncbi:MAG: SRPBCC family protein, partial [Paracoccaceae bacterium]|nr:SRPBCC family protein [Paracoccaceae bacterium]
MPNHSESRHLPFSATQMYDLVADVASYPEFLPWTAAARIKSTKETEGKTEIEADLVISFKVFRERFTSLVSLYEEEHRIDTE